MSQVRRLELEGELTHQLRWIEQLKARIARNRRWLEANAADLNDLKATLLAKRRQAVATNGVLDFMGTPILRGDPPDVGSLEADVQEYTNAGTRLDGELDSDRTALGVAQAKLAQLQSELAELGVTIPA
jgi:uncharacterized coiled-coil protein SlyX